MSTTKIGKGVYILGEILSQVVWNDKFWLYYWSIPDECIPETKGTVDQENCGYTELLTNYQSTRIISDKYMVVLQLLGT